MKRTVPFILLLALAVLVGVTAGIALKTRMTGDMPIPAEGAAGRSASISKKIGFTAVDVAGEISAEISPFKSGIKGTYIEVYLTNIAGDQAVHVEYVKVVFYDGQGAFLDYGEGRIGKTLKPGAVVGTFLYLSKGRSPAFYNENARKVGFDRIGSSEPYQKGLRQL